jgi:hypothetical protein
MKRILKYGELLLGGGEGPLGAKLSARHRGPSRKIATWHMGLRPPRYYDRDKRWRSGAAIKANPPRGGGAKL